MRVPNRGIDLGTSIGALRFAELRRGEMARQFLAQGRLDEGPLIYVFATHDAKFDIASNSFRTGERLPRVEAVPCLLPEAVRKTVAPLVRTRLIGNVVRTFAQGTKAVGVLVTMEAWGASGDKAPEGQPHGWVEASADMETLFMTLEHQAIARPQAWVSIIRRDPLRLDPWKGGDRGGDPGSTTRLSGFINPSS